MCMVLASNKSTKWHYSLCWDLKQLWHIRCGASAAIPKSTIPSSSKCWQKYKITSAIICWREGLYSSLCISWIMQMTFGSQSSIRNSRKCASTLWKQAYGLTPNQWKRTKSIMVGISFIGIWRIGWIGNLVNSIWRDSTRVLKGWHSVFWIKRNSSNPTQNIMSTICIRNSKMYKRCPDTLPGNYKYQK